MSPTVINKLITNCSTLCCVFLVLAFIPLLASRPAVAAACAGLTLLNLLHLPAASGFRPDAKYTHRRTKQLGFGSAPGASPVEGSDAVPQSGILQPSPGATPSPLAAPGPTRGFISGTVSAAPRGLAAAWLWKGWWWWWCHN